MPMNGMTCAYHVVRVVGSTSFRCVYGLYVGPHRAMIWEYVMFAGPAIPEMRILMNRVSARNCTGQSFRNGLFAALRTSVGVPPVSWSSGLMSKTCAYWKSAGFVGVPG